MLDAVNMDLDKLFYRLVGFCYFCAFLSLYIQWDGLYGFGGITPCDVFIARVSDNFKHSASIWESFCAAPSLLVFFKDIGIGDVEALAQFLMMSGMLASASIVTKKSPSSLLFAIVWINYLSLYIVGQTFLSFQWDILLLEVGFLCIWTAQAPVGSPVAWLYRFLAWKLMFLSGCVKLQANCPSWSSLTALEYHMATQPLPTPLAWVAHSLPPTLLRFGVLMTLVLEIPLTFFLIAPVPSLRKIGAITQILLQAIIILTGNYTFFNVLTMTLMLPVYIQDSRADPSWDISLPKACTFTVFFTCISVYSMLDIEHLQNVVTFDEDKNWLWSGAALRLRQSLWRIWAPYAALSVGLAVKFVIIQVLFSWFYANVYKTSATVDTQTQNVLVHAAVSRAYKGIRKVCKVLVSLLVLLICLVMISMSALTMSSISGNIKDSIPSKVTNLAHKLRPFTLTSGYGLFRAMTGMASISQKSSKNSKIWQYVPSVVARPEIEVEGFDEATQSWKPIYFAYKPGDEYDKPRWVAPLQPRLDWQMWFAALGSYNHNPWLVHFAFKLASPGSEHVWQLLDTRRNALIWQNGKRYPKQVKMNIWDYAFTYSNSTWTRLNDLERSMIVPDAARGSPFWKRTRPREYMGAIYAEAGPGQVSNALAFLQHHGFNPRHAIRSVEDSYRLCLRGENGMIKNAIVAKVLRDTVCRSLLIKPYLDYSLTYIGKQLSFHRDAMGSVANEL